MEVDGKELGTDMTIDKKELDAAEQMAAQRENAYEYVHNLDRPFEYEGRTYENMHFDWGKLTGNDGLAIENEMQAKGTPVVIPSLSGEYLIRMASRASVEGIAVNVLAALPIREYNRIRSEARSFLLRTELY